MACRRSSGSASRWTRSPAICSCFGIGAALVGLSSIILFRKISSPLRRLADATKSLSQEDFSKRVDIESNDEIGQLSHSFNTMAETLEEHERELKGLNAMLERKVKETQALYRIGTEISSSLELNQILRSVVENAKELLQADCASAVGAIRQDAMTRATRAAP